MILRRGDYKQYICDSCGVATWYLPESAIEFMLKDYWSIKDDKVRCPVCHDKSDTEIWRGRRENAKENKEKDN